MPAMPSMPTWRRGRLRGRNWPRWPDDTATADQVIAAAENIVACLNAGNFLGFAALVTPDYLLTSFGTFNPYDVPVFLEGFPPQELRSVGEAETHEDGRVSVVLTTVLGGTQVDRFRAYFVPTGGPLLLDEEEPLRIVGADATVDVAMEDFAFNLSRESVPAGAFVSFTIGNNGQYPHEFAVVRLPEGVTVDQVLADPALEEQVRFIGGVFAEPGEIAYLGLEGLEPGVYTVVCFVDEPEGVPHVVRGMVAEFVAE
jgi:plastocyanin